MYECLLDPKTRPKIKWNLRLSSSTLNSQGQWHSMKWSSIWAHRDMKIYPNTTAYSSQPLSLTTAWDSAASITGGWIMRVSGEAGGCGWWGAASRRMPLLKGTCRWGESDGLGVWERDGENLLLSLRGSQCSASSHPHLWDRMRKCSVLKS